MADSLPYTTTRFVVIALYAIVALISYRWLIPRLPSAAKILATFMLATLALIVAIAFRAALSNSYVLALFRVSSEYNAAVAFSATQLAFAAEIALLTALLARGRPLWRRLYMLVLSLLLFYMACDEMFVLHEYVDRWHFIYGVLGLSVAGATVLVMRRSPRHTWIWHICLLSGLAVGAAGALLVEELRYHDICGYLGFLYRDADPARDRCLVFLIEESMEYLGVWLVLVSMLGFLSDVVAKPKRQLCWLLYALPVVSSVLWVAISDPDLNQVHRDIQKRLGSPADVTFESGVTLYGYQLKQKPFEDSLDVSLWLSALPFGYHGLGYSIHLLDPLSATSYSSENAYVKVSGKRVRGPWYLPVYRQNRQVGIPAHVPRNTAVLVVLSVWRAAEDHFTPQIIVSSDHRLLSDRHVVVGELALPAESSASAAAPIAIFADLLTLGLVDLPERARPGDMLSIAFNWRADIQITKDYVQFLHFVHQESGAQWGFDQEPLGARMPTRLWYGGLADSETWEIPLPADLAPGRYQVFTGLYRASDLERLPATDADGAPHPDARIPLGAIHIEEP
ncbi:MAG: hypothetical protein OXG49_11000 [Chloroflexi bacterium]|nr:hypothetical protein [Chloroflexota bacterium]